MTPEKPRNINFYLNLSPSASTVADIFTNPEEFKNTFFDIKPEERESYIRHIIVNNLSFLFQEKPLLLERLKEYIALHFEVQVKDILLIGSAKTGFSISPGTYGRLFDKSNSDIDFSIINSDLFEKLSIDFDKWLKDYQEGAVIAKNNNQVMYWQANSESVPRQIKRGFIDTYKIPSYKEYPRAQLVNEKLSLIGKRLSSLGILNSEKISLRVYKNPESFYQQIYINTQSIVRNLS